MFSIKYIEKISKSTNGQICAKIFDGASLIYGDDEFLFPFKVWLKDKLIRNCLDNDGLKSLIKNKNDLGL